MKPNQPITNVQKQLALANILLYLGMVIINSLANILPINGLKTGEISDRYPNLFVPAGFTFSIWGVIYLFLLISIIYQTIYSFSNKNGKKISSSFQLLFAASLILNFLWILAWHYLLIIPSVIIMVTLLRVLVALYYKTREVSKFPYWAFKAPVELYYGWIVVATIANFTAFLVEREWSGCPFSPSVWTIIMVVVGLLLTVFKLEIYKAYIFASVFIWAYIGIIAKRNVVIFDELTIVIAAAFSVVIISLYMTYSFLRTRYENRSVRV